MRAAGARHLTMPPTRVYPQPQTPPRRPRTHTKQKPTTLSPARAAPGWESTTRQRGPRRGPHASSRRGPRCDGGLRRRPRVRFESEAGRGRSSRRASCVLGVRSQPRVREENGVARAHCFRYSVRAVRQMQTKRDEAGRNSLTLLSEEHLECGRQPLFRDARLRCPITTDGTV